MATPIHPVVLAAAWMAGTLISFMGMAVAGRELAGRIGTFELLFFRSLIGLAIISIVLTRLGWRQVATRRIGLHVIRNAANLGGQFGWFYGIGFIPLAKVFALEFTAPIWALLLAPAILGERVTVTRAAAVCLGIVGMLVILRPGLVPLSPAVLAVLLSALAYSLSHMTTKKLIGYDTPLCIIFYMTVIQLPLSLLAALADWKTPTMEMWPWLIIVGVTALTAHYCMARAFRLADAMVVIPLDFLRLPLIALVGSLFYSEPLDWFVIIGALLMFSGNLANMRAERKKGH